MEKLTKSRETLEQIFKITEVDGKFYQDKLRVGLKELKPFVIVKAHKYGKALAYEYIQFYNYKTHKTNLMSYHSFVYAWYKGEVPAGYDVDHIDNDTLNNDIDNLQLLTHEENIKKRGGGKNQYTAAKENGLPKPTYNRKNWNRGRKLERHSDEFLEKQAARRAAKEAELEQLKNEKAEVKAAKRIAMLEEKLKVVMNTPYRYKTAKDNTIKKIETEIKNLKEFQQNG